MNDEIVLITGGNRGIGAQITNLMSRDHRVAITYRSQSPNLDEFDNKENVFPFKCDVSSPADVDEMFSKIEEQLGKVSILIACAGATKDALALRMSEESWHEIIETNLSGSFRVAKRALSGMIKAHYGRVIFISSVVGFIGSPGQINYAASKSGLIGLARSLAREVGSRHITVNVVSPGAIDTEMLKAAGDKRIDALVDLIPLGRVGQAHEVASLVEFLASKNASYITGAVIPVDGGMGMGM